MWRRAAVVALMFVTVFTAMALAPRPVLAAQQEYCTENSIIFLGMPTWYKYIHTWDPAESECRIDFDVNDPDDISLVALAVFEILLFVGGIVSVIYVVYGGFRYITSRGESDQARSARNVIQNALIGLMITIFASAMVNLVARGLTG